MSRQGLQGVLHFNDQLNNYLHKRLTNCFSTNYALTDRTPQLNAVFNTHAGQTEEKKP